MYVKDYSLINYIYDYWIIKHSNIGPLEVWLTNQIDNNINENVDL